MQAQLRKADVKPETYGNHVQVTLLQRLVELVVLVRQSASLERLWRATHARPERKLSISLLGGVDGRWAIIAAVAGYTQLGIFVVVLLSHG